MNRLILFAAACLLIPPAALRASEAAVKLAVFDVDATPPVGSAMAYGPVKRLDEMTLRCRGIVLLGEKKGTSLIRRNGPEVASHESESR